MTDFVQFISANNIDLIIIVANVGILMLMTYLITRNVVDRKMVGLRSYNQQVNGHINDIINKSSEFKALVDVDVNKFAKHEKDLFALQDELKTKSEKLAYLEKSSATFKEENERLEKVLADSKVDEKTLKKLEKLEKENRSLNKKIEDLKSTKTAKVDTKEIDKIKSDLKTFKQENNTLKQKLESAQKNADKMFVNENKKLKKEVQVLNTELDKFKNAPVQEVAKTVDSKPKVVSSNIEGQEAQVVELKNNVEQKSKKKFSLFGFLDSRIIDSKLDKKLEEIDQVAATKIEDSSVEQQDSKAEIVNIDKVAENMNKDELVDIFKKLLAS